MSVYPRRGRYVDAIWIRQRMDRTDARFQAAARQLGLAPEVLPYASVEIVRVDGTVDVVTARAQFHALLTDPATPARLDSMIADNARIDAQLREDDRLDDAREGDGSTCGAACGYCGRCS